jgi:hypothetical protein
MKELISSVLSALSFVFILFLKTKKESVDTDPSISQSAPITPQRDIVIKRAGLPPTTVSAILKSKAFAELLEAPVEKNMMRDRKTLISLQKKLRPAF